MADTPSPLISIPELNAVYEQLKDTLKNGGIDMNATSLSLNVPINGTVQIMTLSKQRITLGIQSYTYEISAGLSIDFNGLEWQTDHAMAKVSAGLGMFKVPLELALPQSISDAIWTRIIPVLEKIQRGDAKISETAGSYKGVPITMTLVKE